MDETELLSQSITKGIAYAENGGRVNMDNPSQGKTGEMKSIYQFTPATWKNYSKQIFGKEVPMNKDTETHVVNEKVKGWIKKGYTTSQIASMWNAGTGEPNAYTGKFSNGSQSSGINKKYNVKFDVPGYANKVLNYSKQFYQEKKSKPSLIQENNQQKPQENNSLNKMESIMNMIKLASRKTNQPAAT